MTGRKFEDDSIFGISERTIELKMIEDDSLCKSSLLRNFRILAHRPNILTCLAPEKLQLGKPTSSANRPYCKYHISGAWPSIILTGLPHSAHMLLCIGWPELVLGLEQST
jgi:hypothetical protein